MEVHFVFSDWSMPITDFESDDENDGEKEEEQ